MAQILPQRTNLGTDIGRALGMGLEQGIPQGMHQQFQRGQLQEALSQAKATAGNKNSTPLDTAFALMEAGAGIPGSEKYLSTLLPLIMNQQRGEQIYGGGRGQEGVPQPIVPNAGNAHNPGMPPNANQPKQNPNSPNLPKNIPNAGAPPSSLNPNLPQAQEQTNVGILPKIPTPDEVRAQSENAARAMNDPSSLPGWQQYYATQSKLAETQNNTMREYAKEQGVPDKDLAEFMQLGQRYGYMNNRDDWLTATKRDYDSYKNNLTQLEAAFIPGFFTGLVGGKKSRQEKLSKLDDPVRNLVSLGKEADVRKKLASEHLSPTEIEERIHPLPKDFNNRLSKFPSNPNQKNWTLKQLESHNKSVSDWLKNNITPDMSLAVVRDKLVKDKNFEWTGFAPAIQQAVTDGLNLTESQRAELSEVNTQAPRDSLSEIFTDWPRFIQYFRGNK
jgi:hypothetical protein